MRKYLTRVDVESQKPVNLVCFHPLAVKRLMEGENVVPVCLANDDNEADEAMASKDQEIARLRGYAVHKAGCEKAENPGNNFPCTCGLEAPERNAGIPEPLRGIVNGASKGVEG